MLGLVATGIHIASEMNFAKYFKSNAMGLTGNRTNNASNFSHLTVAQESDEESDEEPHNLSSKTEGSSVVLEVFNVSSTRSKIGSWMGNNWIPPPGWKLYSMDSLRRMFASASIHLWGDSTARRVAATLHMILESPLASDISVQQLDDNNILDNETKFQPSNCPEYIQDTADQLIRNFGGICHVSSALNRGAHSLHDFQNQTTPSPKESEQLSILSWQRVFCLLDLNDIFEDKIHERKLFQKHTKVIVISIGAWHEGNKHVCGRNHQDKNYTYNTIQELYSFLEKANAYQKQSNKTLIWRTPGFFADSGRDDPALIRALNKAAMDTIDSYNNPGLTYINYGEAVEPRSFGAARITGGHVAHYGYHAFHVAIQMMANHLVDLGILQDDTKT